MSAFSRKIVSIFDPSNYLVTIVFDDTPKNEKEPNYGQADDLAYFEGALCGCGRRRERERG